nr:unnamed protein product [Digitaria exilis]
MGRSSWTWTALLLLLPTLLPVPSASSSSRLTIHPGCQASCGGVDIPYPFGIGVGCFQPGFEIACVTSTTPVLAGTSPAVRVLSLSVMPRPEARVTLPVAYQCYNQTGDATDDFSYGTVDLNPAGVYRISNTYNELFVLGCYTLGYTNSGPGGRYSAQDGACAGIGCCRVDILPGLADNKMKFSSCWWRDAMEFSPCDYAFIVEKGYYTFRATDLRMDVAQATMPLRLDWAIRGDGNGTSMSMSCAQAANRPGYTCKSDHSECVDSTNGPGYVCNCTKGYEGNLYLDEGCTKREVKKMTGNYGSLLGKGAFGEVYRGTLKDKTTVAVKKSSAAVDKDKVVAFVKEVEIQSRMIHKNVLRLKGCCLEVKFPVLVYKYAAEGSLRDIIRGSKNGQMTPFPLEQRLDIANGSAEGLAYMHTYTASIIQHGDVKPENILLDCKLVPKLSDFGLSKLLAPGKQKPIVPGEPEGGECRLVTEFREIYDQENRRREILDKDIATEENIPVLAGISKLAIECLAEEDRPDMAETSVRRLIKHPSLKNLFLSGNNLGGGIEALLKYGALQSIDVPTNSFTEQ